MTEDRWPGEWMRGVLSLCVLRVVADGPTYGYAIAARLAEAGLGSVKGGTLYPILVEAFTGDQISVGRPFFDSLAVPLAFALLLAMGVGPYVKLLGRQPERLHHRHQTHQRQYGGERASHPTTSTAATAWAWRSSQVWRCGLPGRQVRM